MTTLKTKSEAAELQIEKLVYGGEGLARQEGRVVLTPFVLPGETVQAQLTRQKNDLWRGALTSITQPAPERVTPPCPYFGECGGCHLQQAGYSYQVQQKIAMLREVLRRVGRLDAPESIEAITAEPLHYRNRSQFHFRDGQLGYLAQGTHTLVPIDHCPISSPKINEVIKALVTMAKDRRFPRFLRELEVFTNGQDVQLNVIETERPLARTFFDWCAEMIPGVVSGPLNYEALSRTFRVSYRSFFQVNRFLLDALVNEALWEAKGHSALDLYAGVGLFSVPLRDRFETVTAVEASTAAVRDLEANASDNVIAIRGATEEYLTNTSDTPDYILADPPRAGLQKEVVQHLLRLQPQRITIVSCDPSTLARDLTKLIAGGYEIARLTLVDLFPQTYHLETVTHLQRR